MKLEDKVKNLEWEKEVLLQKFGKIKEEKDELHNKLENTIYSVQHKTGFKVSGSVWCKMLLVVSAI